MNRLSDALFPARITRGSYCTRRVLPGGLAAVAGGLPEAGGHAAGGSAVVLMGGAVSLILFSCVALFRAILLRSLGALFVLALLFVPSDAFAPPRRCRSPGA